MGLCAGCAHADLTRNRARCPQCDETLDAAPAAAFVVPFWRRLPRLAGYPLTGQAGGLLVVWALGLHIALKAGLLGVPALAIFALTGLRYLSVVLEDTANGRLAPPRITADMFLEGFQDAVKLALCCALLGYLGRHAATAGPWAEGLYLLGLAAALPALVIAFAIEPVRVVDPRFVLGLMRRIGPPYALLCALVLGLGTLARLALDLALAGGLPAIAGWSAFLYLGLVLFHLLGYVVFQYHDRLGYGVALHVADPLESQPARAASPASRTGAIRALVAQGRREEALERLERALEQHPDLELRALHHQLARELGRTDLLREHAPRYVSHLLHEGRAERAAAVFEETLALDPALRLPDADRRYALAERLEARGAVDEAFALARDFPLNHPDTPRMALLAARILAEHLGRRDEALEVLERARLRCLDRVQAQALERYRRTLAGGS